MDAWLAANWWFVVAVGMKISLFLTVGCLVWYWQRKSKRTEAKNMKHVGAVTVGLLATLLVACGGGGGGGGQPTPAPAGTVAIDCADLTNADTTVCEQAAAAGVRYINTTRAVTVLEYGELSRSESATIAATITNTTEEPYTGYFDIILDVDCKNGQDTVWRMVYGQPVTIQPGDSYSINMGGRCEAADLGPSSITFSLYDDQARTTLRDQVVGLFTLIE